jgi:hypothetical protein
MIEIEAEADQEVDLLREVDQEADLLDHVLDHHQEEAMMSKERASLDLKTANKFKTY